MLELGKKSSAASRYCCGNTSVQGLICKSSFHPEQHGNLPKFVVYKMARSELLSGEPGSFRVHPQYVRAKKPGLVLSGVPEAAEAPTSGPEGDEPVWLGRALMGFDCTNVT